LGGKAAELVGVSIDRFLPANSRHLIGGMNEAA
jgi:hypothetical protein